MDPHQKTQDPNTDQQFGPKSWKAIPEDKNRIQIRDPLLDLPFVGSCGSFLGALWALLWLWAAAGSDLLGGGASW